MGRCWARSTSHVHTSHVENFSQKYCVSCEILRFKVLLETWAWRFCQHLSPVIFFCRADAFTLDDSACYCFAYCYVQVNRTYRPQMWVNVIRNKVKQRQLTYFVVQLLTLNSNNLSTRNLRVFWLIYTTVINFWDWHLTWLSQLKPNVKVGQSL